MRKEKCKIIYLPYSSCCVLVMMKSACIYCMAFLQNVVLDGKQAGKSSLTSELIFVASNTHVPRSRCKFLNLAGEGEGDEDETHHLLTCVAAPQVKIV